MEDSLLMEVTKSSIFLFSRSFFCSSISSNTCSPEDIIYFCFSESLMASLVMFFSYMRIVSKYYFYWFLRLLLTSLISRASDFFMLLMSLDCD